MAMKKDSDKKNCDKACSMAIFAAVALVGVSQLLTETEKYTCQERGLSPPTNFCGDEGGGSMPTCAGSVPPAACGHQIGGDCPTGIPCCCP